MRIINITAVLVLIMACSFHKPVQKNKLKYVALGDSYTCCEGAKTEESWPVLLTKQLNDSGINMELSANPARTGWTTQDLIDNELPIFEQIKPDFVTLLIGVNDWVRGVDSGTFHKNLVFILDKVQGGLPDKSNLILITIPDFGVTPTGAMYSGGRNIAKGIAAFNAIIEKEALKRGLKCIDIYPETQKMKNNKLLTASDGLHPSALEYSKWKSMVYPVVYRCLKK
ncbi:MAG TPA: SGNH/GDSL hydrolase family protein [Bacteroidia bacterium]|jgi:lysophospholipase L1-like esterase|nr:SGNH/GDSL hydrolase family protein [Bacteroidia bacterium]